MTTLLEQDIMHDIERGENLSEVLQRYNDEDKEIAAVEDELCNLFAHVVYADPTKSQQAASLVIQAHMRLYHAKSHDEYNEIMEDYCKLIANLA
jgi:hypothetical protein